MPRIKLTQHVVGDKVEAAYRRGDLMAKRKQLAEAWGKHCCSPPMQKADVVPIRRLAAADKSSARNARRPAST